MENRMGNGINMTREQRAALLDRIDVLNKVKGLMLLPEIYMVTVRQLAEYFEETEENIRKCYSSHKDELTTNGVVSLTPSQLRERLTGKKFTSVGSRSGQLICINDDCYFEMNNRGAVFFPPRAILNMAMLLPKSPVAREIRNQLLNITEATAPVDRIVAIEDEEKMISDVARAYCSGDITALANASSIYAGYLNRHLAAARAEITTLNTEKAALSEANATLSTENAALSEANAMLTEKSMVWEPRQTLNALVRAIAATAFDHKYSAAWDRFYRELKYREGILIARRSGVRDGKAALDSVRDEEWPKLMKVITSLCMDYGVDVTYATNAETVRAYNLDIVETEFGIRRNRGTVVWKMNDAGAAAAM